MTGAEDIIEGPQPVLGPWFVERMMTDSWFFGVVLRTGSCLVCASLLKIDQLDDETWIDLQLVDGPNPFGDHDDERTRFLKRYPPVFSPTERATCSIRLADVLFVVELADT